MKKKLMITSLLVASLCFLPIAGGEANPFVHTVQAESISNAKTITVSGVGEVNVTPDVVHVHFGVHTTGKTALAAYQSNAATFSKVKEALVEKKIAEKDIQTIRLHAYPVYDYRESGRELTGYEVDHVLRVTYRDLDTLGSFLDTLAEVGVNRIENIEYATEKRNEYELQALEKALASARQKAEVLAKAQGKVLKEVLLIQEGASYNTPIFRNVSIAPEMHDTASKSMEIYTGELTITKQVQVVYQFE